MRFIIFAKKGILEFIRASFATEEIENMLNSLVNKRFQYTAQGIIFGFL